MTKFSFSESRVKTWQAFIIALLGAIASIITAYKTIPPSPITPAQKQGLDSLASIRGKWKYICTDYNSLYQHGGTFIVEKQTDGSYFLSGQRKWKDVFDTISNKWQCRTFRNEEILTWNSTWIYVHNLNQFNMEYEITVDANIVKGYCTGIINKNSEGDVKDITGYFYQLLPRTPLLAGKVVFTKINNDEFVNPNYMKNHDCN